MPFVTAGEADVGISAFIGNKVTVFDENTVTVDMFGSAKYRNYKYGADDHVAVVHTEKLNKYAAIYVASAVHKKAHNGQFDYGKNFYAKDADELNIMLPVKRGSNTPDWDYMQKCVSKIEEETKARVDKYLSDNGLNSAVSEQEKQILTEKRKFAEFKVSRFFVIHPTKAYSMLNDEILSKDGKNPVMSNSELSNGIGGYSKLDCTEKAGTITFSDTTTGGNTIFYQDQDFIGYPHVQGMYGIDSKYWDIDTSFFFMTALRKASGTGFDYATKFNREIVADLMVFLPIQNNIIDSTHKYHDEGYVPDWDYMERYIDVLMRQTAARVM